MSYNVYLVSYAGMPRNHQLIFVETAGDLSGHVYQVTGSIQNGMTFEKKPGKKPEDSATFEGKTLIGKVTQANLPRLEQICQGIPPPKKQFNGPQRLNPQEPLRRCQEWTSEAIQALVTARVVQK